MKWTAEDYEKAANERISRSQESFERCGTDGFLSQWANDITAQQYRLQAEILRNNGKAEFVGLYEGSRRVKAKIIHTKFGSSWLLHDDERDLIRSRGKKFIPVGERSRIQSALGLREAKELASAKATIAGSGTGLSGCASAYVDTVRTGDPWGSDATLI